MTRGRKAKPRAIKVLTGNPGKRALPPEVEPPATGSATMPEFLSDFPRAVEIWNDLAPVLTILGTLRHESQYMLASLCWLQADFERDPSAASAATLINIRSLSSSLGMDPITQAKFISKTEKKEIDPAEAFFKVMP